MSQHESVEIPDHRAHLEAILQTAVDAIITIDERGIVQTANPATEKLFGYRIEEVVGENVSMLMPSPYAAEHDSYIRTYLDTGMPRVIGKGREVVARHKDGRTFPIHLAINEMQVAQRRFFTGVVRDGSALKEAEAELASLGRIVEDSLNELYFFDAETLRFTWVNRGARENLGYSEAELAELTPVEIKPDFNRERFLELIAPLKSRQKKKLRFETRHRRKDGSGYEVEVHLQLAQLKGRPVFVAMIMDTTLRMAAELQLSRINEELEHRMVERTEELRAAQAELLKQQKLATLGQVSGGIAHEIRNPLNAIKTSAYFLLNAKQPSPTKVSEHLERIDRQVTLIDNVITALSDVARLPEANLVRSAIRPCLLHVLESTSLPPNVSVTADIPSDLPDVLVDENQVPIVFRNLVRNARDAMPDGGTITVSAKAERECVKVSVRDEGMGISPDELDRIMEPLYSTKSRGMGLGLAITRAILKKNQGEINVQSELGVGTTFYVTLRTA